VLDELVAAGTLFIQFSGGDLFLRPDALDILRAARARHFDVKIITHGNHVTDAVADALAEMGVTRVGMSLYSDDPAEHEAVTLVPGSHAKTIAAGERLAARGVKVQYKTPIMVHNRRRWHGVERLAADIGAAWEIDGHIQPDDQADFGLCGIGAHSTERIVAVMTSFREVRHLVIPVPEMPDAPSDERTCSAGTGSAYITPDGRVWPCILWRDSLGSLREHTFDELWHGNAKIEKMREVRRASYLADCSGCGYHGKCGYCPGLSHAETGDPGRRSGYVCERTHLTMAALEYVDRLNERGAPLPAPGGEAALFEEEPTFAERQWAARKAGMARPADRIPLVQIDEPARARR
jgi:radical SAM protein with 4Fe4S-binding SPASM domain